MAVNIASLLREVWHALGAYLRPWRRGAREPLADRRALEGFLHTRASYVAQTSLYGYLRTRAGMRYPELFADDAFVVSINVAKWHVWLACLSDLTVYAGGLLAARQPHARAAVPALMREALDAILADTGIPEGAGEQFSRHAEAVRRRIAQCDYMGVGDDESAFCDSPSALVEHAPIVDELKALDETIVRNSVRFRWQEVRRELRRALDADALLRDAGDPRR